MATGMVGAVVLVLAMPCAWLLLQWSGVWPWPTWALPLLAAVALCWAWWRQRWLFVTAMMVLFTLQLQRYGQLLVLPVEQHYCNPEHSLLLAQVVSPITRRAVLQYGAKQGLWQQGVTLQLQAEFCGQRWFARHLQVRVWLQPGEPVLRGDRLVVRLALAPLSPAHHPFELSVEQRWWRTQLATTAQARSIHMHVNQVFSPWRVLDSIRLALAIRLEQGFSPQVHALLKALLLADTSNLSNTTRQQWASLGLAHLLSISGLHVACVAWLSKLLATLACSG